MKGNKMNTIKNCAVLLALSALPWMTACVAGNERQKMQQSADTERMTIGAELIVNTVVGSEMFGVEMFADGSSNVFYGKAHSNSRNIDKMSFPLPRIPQKVRVIWRGKNTARLGDGRIDYGGPLTGDYSIPVASRIPEAVLEDVRRHGGAIRIKFRLKPDGVMLGWDIQRSGANVFEYTMVGGDFLDTRY